MGRDPGQRLANRFRLLSRVLPERLEEGVGIETVKRKGDGASIEVRDLTLLLVGFDAGCCRVVESGEELQPGVFEAGVGGGGIGYGPQERAPLIADVNQPGQRLTQQSDRITNALKPGFGNVKDFLLQHVQQGLHQLVQIVEVLVERRAAHAG